MKPSALAAMMHLLMLAFLCLVSIDLALTKPAYADAKVKINAEVAYLFDPDSGVVLFEKNINKRVAPASIAKLMLVAVVLRDIKNGKFKLDDVFTVSSNAWKKGGSYARVSSMFLLEGEKVKLEDLLKGVIVISGNDACITLAENMYGSEEAFTREMNIYAKELGLTNSNFTNVTGLPDENLYMTLHDIAKLSTHLIYDHPNEYAWFKLPNFTWNKVQQNNRNPMIFDANLGGDGLKTGYTEKSGYGVAASAIQDGLRLIGIIHGLPTSASRARDIKKLFKWGFKSYRMVTFFHAGEKVGKADVFGGKMNQVELQAIDDVKLRVMGINTEQLEIFITYKGPLSAPITQGQYVADFVIHHNGRAIQSAPLYAANEVQSAAVTDRAIDAVYEIFIGWIFTPILQKIWQDIFA